MSTSKLRTAKRITPAQVETINRLFKTHPSLTNGQIAQLIGTSESTVGAERRGVRAPRTAARKAAFETLVKEMGKVIPRPAPVYTGPYDLFPGGVIAEMTPPQVERANGKVETPSQSIDDINAKALKLAAEIRVQALTALRQNLTNAKISPEDALLALETK